MSIIISYTLFTCRDPSTLKDCVIKLQKQNMLVIPETDDQWYDISRNEIDIRRDDVLVDALKEGNKRRFDPCKLLKV